MKRNHKLKGGILWLLSLFLAGMANAQVIGFWQFDEQSPGNTASTNSAVLVDASGNGHNGTVSDPGVLYVTGNTNYAGTSALRFTIGPDHVTVPDIGVGSFNFSTFQSVTIEAMVKTTNIGQDGIGCIVAKQGAVSGVSGEWWWRINANGTQQFFVADPSTSKNVSGTHKLNDGQWHHLAAVYDATAQQLRVYVDYVQDGSPATAVISSGGTIGNDKDLWIGAFQAANRQFDGDIDFVRISAGALQPDDFVQPLTFLSNVVPANGATFLPASTPASFTVKSPTVGVPAANILVLLNGTNISSLLQLTGSVNDWTVSLPALTANRNYRLEIAVTDLAGHKTGQTNLFNTFSENFLFIEAEDYNFDGGQFIDNPVLSSADGPNTYLDRLGVEGTDYHKTNPPVTTLYRIGDQVGTAISTDALRQNYIDAIATDPGVADYMARDFVNGEWLNYTRTFPANTYHVYLRYARSGAVTATMSLDEVTAGSTSSSQTTSPVGVFRAQATGSTQAYGFVPLTDALGNEVGVSLSGVKTLKLSMVSGITGLNLNYLVFVPQGAQSPFVASVLPVPGGNSGSNNVSVQATIRNASTQVNTGSIQLKLDGTSVTPTVAGTSTGAQVSYTASALALGVHTATLIFTDSASSSVTNTWQFVVPNPSVRAYWNFNEKAPGNSVNIAAGAILDASGNGHNGTANDPSMQYVAGSFNYGNSSALRFTPGADRVVIPDPAGSFNFQGSFTWEAVLRTTTTGTNLAVLAKNGTGDGEGEFWWRVPATGGTQSLGMNDGTGLKFLAGTNVLTDGTWHHVAVVCDTNTAEIRIYADYKLDATLTNVYFTNIVGRPADLQIGSFIGGGSDFDGDIDAIRISNGALTTGQFIQTTVALPPLVKAVRPNTNAVHVFPMPAIQMDVQNRDTQVTPASCKMFIDGNDVSSGIVVTSSVSTASIQFKPTSPLADGLHTVVVRFSDTASPANSITNQWSFTVVNNEPVLGYYQFNEKAPGSTADTTTGAILDSSSNARNGTVTLAGLPYVEGSPSYGDSSALEFTVAATNHVSIPDPTSAFNFTPAQSITLEAIIKTTNIGQGSVGAIMAKQSVVPPEWWWRINATGFQQFNVNDATVPAKSVTGNHKLNDGKWHHVAVIYDAAAKQLRAYVDYAQDGSTVATTFTSSTSVIGANEDLWIAAFQAGNRLFEGDIDAVRLTAAPLDPSWFIPLGGITANVTIKNITLNAGSVSFSFATSTGRSYVVQSTTSLGGTWTDVETVVGDGTQKTVSYSAVGGQKFFRISVQ
jgi:Concanavalin A-like lectin/glucanases superfamily